LSVFYLLQACIRDPLTQRRGFLFICDLRSTKLLQVDRKLVKCIMGMFLSHSSAFSCTYSFSFLSFSDMLSNKFPARLKKVLLLEPPTFFNIAFRIIRPLIPAKYMEKLATAHLPDLQAYVDADKLLPDYGGTLQFDHNTFVDQLSLEEQKFQQNQQMQNQPMPQIQNTTQNRFEPKPINPTSPAVAEGVASC
jgi:tyrosine-protein phosphatase non-receptor type 9